MKKLLPLLLTLTALMIFVSTGIAADEVTEFSPLTLGDLVAWEDTEDDVWNLVNQYKDSGLTCESDEDEDLGTGIACTAEIGDEEDDYYFYFTSDDKPTLYLVLASMVLPEGADYMGVLNTLVDSYGVADAAEYTGSFVDTLIEGEDHYVSVAGDTTVFVMTGTEETKDAYATVSMYMGYKDIIDQLNTETAK